MHIVIGRVGQSRAGLELSSNQRPSFGVTTACLSRAVSWPTLLRSVSLGFTNNRVALRRVIVLTIIPGLFIRNVMFLISSADCARLGVT